MKKHNLNSDKERALEDLRDHLCNGGNYARPWVQGTRFEIENKYRQCERIYTLEITKRIESQKKIADYDGSPSVSTWSLSVRFVTYGDRYCGFEIKPDYPCIPEYDEKTPRCSNLKTATNKLTDIITKYEEVCNRSIEEADLRKEESVTKSKLNKKAFTNLADFLDVPLKTQTGTETSDYVSSPGFKLQFRNTNPDAPVADQLFAINSVTATLTRKELKQLIRLIGGNPRAIAARLGL